jgi:hypothetical protein
MRIGIFPKIFVRRVVNEIFFFMFYIILVYFVSKFPTSSKAYLYYAIVGIRVSLSFFILDFVFRSNWDRCRRNIVTSNPSTGPVRSKQKDSAGRTRKHPGNKKIKKLIL